MAIPELTAADKVLMGEIAALHAQRQAATTQAEKDAFKQQIMEKQQLLSTHTSSAATSTPAIESSQLTAEIDAKDDRIRERIVEKARKLLEVPKGPARDAIYAEVRVLRKMMSPKAKAEEAAMPMPRYKRKRIERVVIGDVEPLVKKVLDLDVSIISETSQISKPTLKE